MADLPTLSVTMLGAGQEVGRSCCILQYRGKTIVCDTGVHPAYSGMASLPFVDELDWSTVDAILITQYVLQALEKRITMISSPPFSEVSILTMQLL
jgi:cleavage and polyadenylation specificity factor subunit 3